MLFVSPARGLWLAYVLVRQQSPGVNCRLVHQEVHQPHKTDFPFFDKPSRPSREKSGRLPERRWNKEEKYCGGGKA